MSLLRDVLIVLLLLVGSGFALLGGYSLVKLPTFFQRLHGPTKASTLGVGCLLAASVLYQWKVGNGLHPRELLVTVFLFLTAPVSAHMMSLAALRLARPEDRPEPPENSGPQQAEPEPRLLDPND